MWSCLFADAAARAVWMKSFASPGSIRTVIAWSPCHPGTEFPHDVDGWLRKSTKSDCRTRESTDRCSERAGLCRRLEHAVGGPSAKHFGFHPRARRQNLRGAYHHHYRPHPCLRRHLGRISQAPAGRLWLDHRLRRDLVFPNLLRLRRRSSRHMTEGFEAPLHRSLTEPIFLAGAPRSVAVLNGTLAAAVGIGLHLWIPGLLLWIAGHFLAVWGAKSDPQYVEVFSRHMKHKSFLGS